MRRASLSLRLLIAAIFGTAAALFATSIVFGQLFDGYFRQRMQSELDTHLQQLTANLSVSDTGEVALSRLSDDRFEQPLSGLYWQILRDGDEPMVSRSLWDQPLSVARPSQRGIAATEILQQDDGPPLMARSWRVSVGGADVIDLTMTVAMDMTEIETFAAGFRKNVAIWLSLLGIALIGAAWLQIRLGLRPLDAIRTELKRVNTQPGYRLPDVYPTEVSPLVDEVNILLDTQQISVDRARQRAGDLAHGLKTPLTVMSVIARDVEAGGQAETAAQLDEQIDAMRQFVERELARSRLRTGQLVWTQLAPVATRMTSAIRKLPEGGRLKWSCDIPDEFAVPFDEHDLSELLGNLLDNARKFANSAICVTAGEEPTGLSKLSICDDGPGVPDENLACILERGMRLGENQHGYGLGLAICRQLAESHGCTMELSARPGGGLCASVFWTAD